VKSAAASTALLDGVIASGNSPMPTHYSCPRCAASIAADRVDAARQIATCAACGSLVDLASQMGAAPTTSPGAPAGSSPAEAPRPKQRPPVALPPGMEMSRGPNGLVITRRWLRGKHFVMLAVLMPLTAALAWVWQSSGFQTWMGFAAFFLTSWDFMLVSMFVNSTTITVGEREIDVRHGPMPSLFYRPQRVAVADVEQLFAAPFGALFEVGVVLRDKTRIPLVRPVVSEEQALFVEQQIERRLGLTDVEVAGELGSVLALPDPIEAAVKPATGGALVLLPVLAIPAILMFVFFGVLGTELEGTLQLSGARLGDASFAPSSCRSGQLSGFSGVELGAEGNPGLTVRLIKDPVQGDLVAIQRSGQAPVVVKASDCESMRLEVVRTSTNINDVWNVEGSASFACAELRGELKFAGCH
jgi:hypothetical protein